MYPSTSSLDLTKYDQLQTEDTYSDSGDSHSSGYESSGSCQLQKPTKSKPVRPESETMIFKSTDSLCDNLDYILSIPEMCDVVFLVGKSKTHIYGVKAILATRSRVFYQMILHSQQKVKDNKKKIKSERLEGKLMLEVMNYEDDVFRRLISFVHCGKVKVNLNSVIGLFCAAVEFGLKDLIKACWDYFVRCIENKRETLMTSLKFYCNHKGIKYILNKIYGVTEH